MSATAPVLVVCATIFSIKPISPAYCVQRHTSSLSGHRAHCRVKQFWSRVDSDTVRWCWLWHLLSGTTCRLVSFVCSVQHRELPHFLLIFHPLIFVLHYRTNRLTYVIWSNNKKSKLKFARKNWFSPRRSLC